VQKYLDDLKEKQRVLGPLADCLIDLYAMDTVILRAQQASNKLNETTAHMHRSLAKLYCFESRAKIFQRLRRIAMIMADGAELDALYENLGKLDERYRVDYMALQDEVAARMLEDEGYSISL
jgi:UDP-N-acetyl-D-mannosaminuronic acid transferase (WecB/TagA/CpsF family)